MGRNAVRVVVMSRSSRRASNPTFRGNCRSIPVSSAERVQRCARHRWNKENVRQSGGANGNCETSGGGTGQTDAEHVEKSQGDKERGCQTYGPKNRTIRSERLLSADVRPP